MTKMRVGLVQMRSGVDIAANTAVAAAAIAEAARAGAEFVALPEAVNIIQRDGAARQAALRQGEDEESVLAMATAAREAGVWLLVGSLMLSGSDGRDVNRAHVFAPDGRLIATYDKIHLFDHALGAGEPGSESLTVAPGDRAVVVDTPFGGLGLSICYDLRFPQLYRLLAQSGARLLAAPAAFTVPTGRAHWEILLRARAAENGAFVIAPAQGGRHEDGRTTYGRSLVVSPWGEVIAKKDDDEPGLLLADLDLGEVDQARARIPSLDHDRSFAPP